MMRDAVFAATDRTRQHFRQAVHGLNMEIRPMLQLAIPVIVAEIGWVSMGMVDTLMVGRVSAEAIGAVGIGSSVYAFIGLAGIGLLLGLDHMVSHSFGAGRLIDCHRALVQAVYLSVLAGVPLAALSWLSTLALPKWGMQESVLVLAIPYVEVVSWSIVPLLLYAAFRRYLQAMGRVKVVMAVLISANLVNLLVNWILIFGHLGAPALGATGAAYATVFSQLFMASALFVNILYRESRRPSGLFAVPKSLESVLIRKLLVLGAPAALQLVLEVGVFVAVTFLAGTLSTASLAAHQIVLRVASFSFMIPLGISSAAAVRVGQALGRRDPGSAARSGWTALLLGAAFMAFAGTTFVSFPHAILRAFTADEAVIATGLSLLLVAAVFQLFDGIQVVATGVLRGTGDTRTPMVLNFIGHWLLGLPVGYFLAFRRAWDVRGLWVGLCVGLIAVGASLLYAWRRRIQALGRERKMEPVLAVAPQSG
jgi:MATE family multidrug resistance protein